MFKKQITVNIDELDSKISKLSIELEGVKDDDVKYDKILKKMDSLVELRGKLAESKNSGSIKPVVISGLFGVASILVVLKYEETEVITSKAFNMATSMFRGGK